MQPVLPRFTLVLSGNPGDPHTASTQVIANEADVTVHELTRHVADLLYQLTKQDPKGILKTPVQAAQEARAAEVLRDYPARSIHAKAKVYLCMACDDLYGHLLEGGREMLVPLPPDAPPVACSYHANPALAPMPLDVAAKIPDPSQDDDAAEVEVEEN